MEPALKVVKGSAAPGSDHNIDGLSGATITANGVTGLVQYWLSENAYGTFIKNLREGEML